MMYRLVNDLNSPNVGVIFDPVNYLSGDNYAEQKSIIKRHFELLGDVTYAVHIKDFKIENGCLSDALPTEGIFDFDTLFSEIKKRKKDIPMLLETVGENNFTEIAAKLDSRYEHA